MVRNDDRYLGTLALADVTLLAAHLFVSPSKHPAAAFEIGAESRGRLDSLAHALDDGRLVAVLLPTIELVRQTPDDARRDEWNRLFEGAVICPVNETAYVRRDKGMIIGDICGFYGAFGFEADATCGEKADHLVTEMEFVALLLVMLANAERRGNRGHVRTTAGALRTFLAEHLGEWIRYFALRLNECSTLAVYGGAAALLETWWNALAARFDLPRFGQLDDSGATVEHDPEDTPYECGMVADDAPTYVPLTGPHAPAP